MKLWEEIKNWNVSAAHLSSILPISSLFSIQNFLSNSVHPWEHLMNHSLCIQPHRNINLQFRFNCPRLGIPAGPLWSSGSQEPSSVVGGERQLRSFWWTKQMLQKLSTTRSYFPLFLLCLKRVASISIDKVSKKNWKIEIDVPPRRQF